MTVKTLTAGLNRAFIALESTLLVMILAALLLLANGQIVLRNFFGTGIMGADNIMRILVLWLALFGAMVATRRREHILIDLVSRSVPRHICRYLERGVDVFAAAVCVVIAWFSLTLIQLEFEDATVVAGWLPVWVCQVVIPFSFLVMACRFLFQALVPSAWLPEGVQPLC
ncbi:TRAP transporter small permease [Exilibacterium tricleocarpae]|uniref:TRAP transporter small permease protein n=1 Tax=Exilibacterium tricleocarpae TaxID=2591008 RepID=A0A545TZH5_9GAMM|nr:TRAP transporter small permease [Exilibacterium tricleocarpae]TQV82611.1 TRAP transporter small permease [Exilibacterium tricleocarpae]